MLAAGAGAPAAAAEPALAVAADVERQALDLFALGRGHPALAARRLDELLQQLPAHHPQRWLVVALQAVRAADALDWPRVQALQDTLKSLPGTEPGTVDMIRAVRAAKLGPLPEAETLAAQALGQLRAQAPFWLRYGVLSVLALTKEARGQLAEAINLRRQAVDLAAQQGQDMLLQANMGLAYPLVLAHQWAEAERILAQTETLGQQLQAHYALARLYNLYALVDSERQDLAAEARHLQAGLHHAQRTGSRPLIANSLSNLADHDVRVGRYGEALKITTQALALDDPETIDGTLQLQGQALIGLGRLQEGLAASRAAVAIVRERGNLIEQARYLLDLAQFLERTGHLKEALQIYVEHRRMAFEASQQTQRQAVMGLQEAHEATQRARNIDLLEREQSLQQAALERARLNTRMRALGTVAAAVFTVLAGLLLWRLRRQSQALAQANAHLRRLAASDLLTGLPNRHHWLDRLQAEGEAALLTGAGLMLVDIDHFKHINDQHGHAVGDQVLMQVARRLREALRPQDTLLRWGGEEFVVLAPHITPDELHQLAQGLLAQLRQAPFTVQGLALQVTASIGHARLPLPPTCLPIRWEHAVQAVDAALYQAKAHGRNRAHSASDGAAQDQRASSEKPVLDYGVL